VQQQAFDAPTAHTHMWEVPSLPHLRRDWALTPATFAQGLGSPLPHLHRDWAHSCHIYSGTGPHPCHVCTGTGLALWLRTKSAHCLARSVRQQTDGLIADTYGPTNGAGVQAVLPLRAPAPEGT
jgi:hypothetical protein